MSLFKKPDLGKKEENEEFKLLIDECMKDIDGDIISEEKLESGETDSDEEGDAESREAGFEWGDGYRIHCDENDSDELQPVSGRINYLIPAEGYYLHIDIEMPDFKNVNHLHLEFRKSSGGEAVDLWLDADEIPLYREGNRLHVVPISVMQILGEDYTLSSRDSDFLVISFERNEERIGSYMIEILGPWPEAVEHRMDKDRVAEEMILIARQKGWDNFKTRMEEMLTRCEVGGTREEAGLYWNPPRLHTALIGNPGTGKTRAVEMMARLYRGLGLLDTDQIWTMRVSALATSSINYENEAVINAVKEAKGGTLVIDGAHDLYKTDNKGNYDTEGRIVRALVDCLSKTEEYGRWMLVLVGEPEGMESLLSCYPALKKCLTAPIYMEDFTPEELFGMFDQCCDERDIKLSVAARRKLEMYVLHKYNLRGPGFPNAWLVRTLFDESVIPAMFRRLKGIVNPTVEQLETVMPEDIPSVAERRDDAMAELDELIGLGKIKTKVRDFLYSIRLTRKRMELGLPTGMPRLHMAFLGNPGTGKTTVAEIIGKVFASWGILSGGRVIRTEKSQMVGQYIGETEFKMTNLLSRARGNILFIDEAYQLAEGDEKDHGRIVMNSLLTELGKDNLDMVVILAGYTAPMKRLLESNEGIESRFPNVFNFEDYTADELMEIGRLMVRRQGFTLTDGAAANMRQIIHDELASPSPRFGNGRFVSNLLQNEIFATLGARTAKIPNPTGEDLSTILPEDVIIGKAQKDVVFDEVAIDSALEKLDALSGLDEVKIAVHNFVRSARYLHSIGEPFVGKGLLSWRFVGNCGTGKSTVAEIMARILRGMRLIASSHITEIKGERIFGVSEHDCDMVLKEAVKRACNGLIFIDADDPKFTVDRVYYARYTELIRLKVKELTIESGGECALILAELDSPNAELSEQLREAGVYEFDHTLVFRDFTPEELFGILVCCLRKFNVSFSDEAVEHMLAYIRSMSSQRRANARTMKLLARALYQKVVVRESALPAPPDKHVVELGDIEAFKWDGKKGKIGF